MTNEQKLRDYLKRVTTDLHQTRERLRKLEDERLEPMAVVGMACRFPGGVASPDDFWTLLTSETDAVSPFPQDRGPEWGSVFDRDPAAVGKSYAREGAFLGDAADFDAQFFGISPREALAMDPQQRLLLETSWEALEDAGIDPASLHGTATGVFSGLIYHDYAAGGVGDLEGYVSTGISGGVASGRVAYTLGLEGPAVTVDTACSSSLVAMHLAAAALRSGECTLALAGGVTVMARPGTFVEFSRQGGLAADGRCKAYAEAADGTGWGEGVGVLVLEKLSDARRNGHRVLAVLRGSAVNQDGASNGLTAPNGPSQQRVIQSALAGAGLSAGEVDVIEGHGTGTRLGDPIEAEALLATYGQDRDAASPVLLGSVKSNIGHTQAAAGVAGVIKMVQAMAHGIVPATLHVDAPSSHVDWASGAVALVTEATAWPQTGRPRRAAVSSFGFSGTNAHVILEQAPAEEPAPADAPPADDGPVRRLPMVPWLISARSPAGLAAQAQRLGEFVRSRPELEPADLGWSLATFRSHLPHRAVVVGADRDELLSGADVLATAPGEFATSSAGSLGRMGFVFTGQGSQRLGMGQRLYTEYPVFAEAFDAVCAGLDEHLGDPGRSLAAVVRDDAELLDRTMWTQAGLFAVEVAVFRLLESWGVRPDAVAGHSIGELAAAHVAGVWSLEDACAVVAARGRLMAALPAGGAMLAVEAREDDVRPLLADHPGVGIAAVNGPTAVVVSGPAEAVAALRKQFEDQQVRVRNLRVSHAFHSSLMEPMLAEFAQVTASVSYQRPTVPLVSTVTGLPVTDEVTDPGYWVRQVREPVRFADAVTSLRDEGVRTFVEIGPDGVLSALGAADEVWVPTLRRDRDEAATLVSAVGQLHTRGATVDWAQFYASGGARRVDLPTYAFDRQRFWVTPAAGSTDAAALGQSVAGHPLLGATVSLAASGGLMLTGRLGLSSQPWLADHVVAGRVIVPGAALVEMAIRAGDEIGAARLAELVMETPLVLPSAASGVRVQVVLDALDAGRSEVAIYSQAEEDDVAGAWTRHAVGVLEPAEREPADTVADSTSWPPADAVDVTLDGFYPALADTGLAYGPVFQGVRALWRRGEELFAEVALDAGVDVAGFGLHPALLDAALHGIGVGRPESVPLLPFSWTDVVINATGASTARVRIAPAARGDGVTVTLADESGALIASVGSLSLQALPAADLSSDAALVREALFGLDWVPAAPADRSANGTEKPWAVIGADGLPGLPGAVHYADLAALLAAVDDGAPVPDTAVVCFSAAGTAGAVPEAARTLAVDALGAVQEWLSHSNLTDARLLVVTERAVDVGPGVELRSSSVTGLVRAAAAENPGRLVLVDVEDMRADPAAPGPLLRAGVTLGEPEFAIRQGRVFVPRLARPGGGLAVPDGLTDGGGWRLDFTERGTLENLVLAPVEAQRVLGVGQVRVGLRAGGVNFRDVLNVLGMYPGDAGRLGLEGSGVVLETGPGVTGFGPGDLVMGLFSGAFGPVVVTDQRLLASVPSGWSLAEAAAAPVVFLTAYHALVELADLRRGESILVHAAAGGVGIAAVQLARHLGAEVFGTSSPSKWPVLNGLGLPPSHVASSRTVEFEGAFRAVNGGVDVVLDSLAGEFVDASLRLAAGSQGRFIEMGKADIRDPEQVARDHEGLKYQAFDLLQLDPDEIARMLGALTELFAAGVLTPLPVTCWDVRRAPDAFRYLSQARNIGKVVLTMPAPELSGTVLVTGASGALGSLVARHLATRRGPANLVLLSRRGPEAPGMGRLAAELATQGAIQVQLRAADVADRDQLAAVIAGIPAEAPLRGVVHASGVLDDGLIGSLTPARMHSVMRSKVDAAWHLHELTRHQDLSLFAVFSSIAGIWGSPGQGNYAAANTFLDALAAHRRAQGLPAVSLAWGPWQLDGPGVGGMTGHLTPADWQRMAAQGLQPLSGADGLALLGAVTGTTRPSPVPDNTRSLLIPARIGRSSLSRRGAGTPPLLSGLVPASGTARRTVGAISAEGRSGLAVRLAALSSTEREETVREMVLGQAARVLGMGGLDPADTGRSFRELGFDSLTAVELRNRMGEATGLRLPATLVFDYPTPSALVAFVLTELLGDAASLALPTTRATVQDGNDPVVIVGMGCRFPGGVGSAGEFWGLLSSESDAVTGFPLNRGPAWEGVVDPDPAATGKSYADVGGFLHDAGEFDAQFFGISPREALAMDPQQRLLLETSWEALEDAGIDPGSLSGSSTGVFTGLIYHDYSTGSSTPEEVEGYVSTGNSGGVASGRVSYALGLEGPAVTVDTACSSSLVALHLAVQALRSGECSLALAGGATVMATPGTFVEFSRQRGLAVDGRCKPYADAADGTGWGEGVGVLVVERLSDARRNGHRVLAVVRGSAVNQDGASNGLTAPNGPSQQRVIRAALAGAGLSAGDVDVVEGHGTGTRLGDPIEAQAVLATYGQGRDADSPVLLGSVKSNIGHTQAAAGVAGIIKMVQAMAHGVVPATLHVDEPSGHVDWDAGSVRLVTQATPWPETGRPRRAGVSSFGFSGTNAHVILEQAPQEPTVHPDAVLRPRVVPWLISARSEAALADQAERLQDYLSSRPALDPVDVALSLATTRASLNHRAVIVGADRAELVSGLAALAVADAPPVSAASAGSVGKVGFLFTGQGAQRVAMGQQLYVAYPVFAQAFDVVCAGLEEHLDQPGLSLKAVVGGAGSIDDTMWAQAGLFAVEVALFRLLESWGVAPAMVAGHSIGELAAAHVAGVWSQADACAVVAARGRLMQALPAGGAMLAVQAGEDEVRQLLAETEGVGVAAVNGPTAVVVSGTEESVARVAEAFAAQGVRARKLRVSHAFHSALMEPMLAEFAQVTASVSYRSPQIPLVSTLTGRLVTEEVTDPEYWVRQVREPVRFADAVTTLRESGVRTFVELGPGGVLSALGLQTASGTGENEAWLPTLRRNQDEALTLVSAIGALHARGGTVDWPRFYAGTGAARVDLPTYAFSWQHYWLSSAAAHGDAVGLGLGASGHPLLGAAVNLPASGGLMLTGRLSLSAQPWLADHVVAGRVVLPGAALVEMAIRAGDEAGRPRLAELVIEAPLVLPPQGGVRVQVTVDSVESDDDAPSRTDVAIYSQPEQDDPAGTWTRHAAGVLTVAESADAAQFESWPPAGAVAQDPDGLYPALAAAGLSYGPLFQGVRTLWRRGDEVFAEVALADDTPLSGFALHPALLDAALHPISATDGPSDQHGPLLPFAWTDVVVHATGAREARVRLTPAPTGDGVSLTLADETGALIASVGALVLRPLPMGQSASSTVADEALFTLDWVPSKNSDEPVDLSRWAVLRPDNPSSFGDIPGAVAHSGIGELTAALADGRPAPDTVVMGCPAQLEGPDVGERTHAAAARALGIVQEWLAADGLAEARLVLVTERAVDAGSGDVPVEATSSGIWGLVRVAASENPGRLGLVDLDVAFGSDGAGELVRAAVATGEVQVAVRAGEFLVPRLARVRSAAALAIPANRDAWRLDFTERGTLQNLVLAPVEAEPALGVGQVRVGLRAGGVNFRDVLNVLGMYPGDAGQLGLEGSGVVLETGPGVTRVKPGDLVMGLFSGAFGPVVVTDQRLLAPVPSGWSLAEAAAAPVVFLTAYHALVELADLQRGESILVHAAAGGVGIAAVQLARHLGAEVFGTSSPSKWPVLNGLGLPPSHVASSRTVEFEGAFRAVNGGVDVVLDSLAGEFVDASLRLAAGSQGRFIEMGKADIRDPEQVARDHEGLKYQAFDLLQLDPDEIARMLGALTELFAAGVLTPLPVACWDVRRAPDAFRYLSQARNIGKVVLTMPRTADSQGTVLLTGASGALGSLIARHLAETQQAERLVLLSRRGPAFPGTARIAAELAAQGVGIDVVAADVADRAALAQVIAAVPTGTPLRGVVHAAGILDDGMITSLTPAALEAVMRPKVTGAWNLHELTRSLDLSMFVVFSSIAGIWGNPGQGGYAAANTFLDALAAHRRRSGLPAGSLAWGLWQLTDARSSADGTTEGMAGQLSPADWQRLAAQGMQPLTGADGLALLDAVRGVGQPGGHPLDGAAALLVPARLDPSAFRRRGREVPALMSGLETATARTVRRTAGRTGVDDRTSLAALLAALPPSEQESTVRAMVLTQAALVLGMAGPDSVDAGRSFRELGFDSLTAVELRNQLCEATGLRLSATLVFDYPTPSALVTFVLAELGGRIVDAALPAMARAGTADSDDPVVIVGMGCRFPGGVSSTGEYWNLLASGADAVSGFPVDRGPEWEGVYDLDPDAVGKSYAREGAFLGEAGHFDAQFFGISPREALAMDPQQRLLLETSWEALEDAGIDTGTLNGSSTGVFTGLIYHDYGSGGAVPGDVEGYVSTGMSGGVASGRVAYALGLEGPAVTVDTACSSSLVALHLAAQALRSGECSLALAGGVTVMATPGIFVEFSRQRGLAADGRCKPYADAADGTGWGEGVGVLVVERLSDARRNGHRVLAVVRGTAVNQDGASNGLTAPNGPSQQRVIRTALESAGLQPGDIDVVEGHGTGTRLGDPIEAQAVLATYGQGRDAGNPVLLGSVKSNIGHTQAAAGVAGIIKMVQAMAHGVVPATLHVDEPSGHVDWESGSVRLVTRTTLWPDTGRPRRAGVSSFGFSGTNAHVILEQAPQEPIVQRDTVLRPPVVPWLISARSEAALADQAQRLKEFTGARPDLDPVDVGWSLTTTRSGLPQRAVVVGADRQELLAGLEQLASGQQSASVLTGSAGALGRVGFVFTGQGAQRVGMGERLYAAYPAFAQAFDAVCAGLEEHLDQPGRHLKAVIRGDGEGDDALDRTVWAQAGLFAVEVALFRLLESWGVSPDMVAGHSIGELAAAHVAGVWSLSDACAVVGARGRLMAALPSGGAMLAVQTGEAEVLEVLSGLTGVGVAAVNGPSAVVVSGTDQAVAAVAEEFTVRGVRARSLRVSHAFHSPLMEPMLAEFAEVTASVSYGLPRIPLVSTVTGLPVTDEVADPGYWVRQVREPVRFADAVSGLRQAGVRTFVEIGPDAVLSVLGPETSTVADEAWIPALRRDRDEPEALVAAVGRLWARGGTVDWRRFHAGAGALRVDLPTYAFSRERFWLSSSPARVDAAGLGQSVAGHPLLGAAVELPGSGGLVLTGRLSLTAQPWLADYRTAGRILVPETALIELAVRAGDETGHAHVSELQVHAPLVLPSPGALQIQVVLARPDDDGRQELAVYARPEDDLPHGPWTRHVTGVLAPASAEDATELDDASAEWPPAGAQSEPESTLRHIDAVWWRGEETFAEITLDESLDVTGFGLHPALLDAVLSLIGPACDAPMLASAWTDVVVHATGAAAVRARLVPVADSQAVSVTLTDDTGGLVASVGSLTLRPLSPEELPAESPDSLFELAWIPVDPDPGSFPAPERVAVVGPDCGSTGQRWPDAQRHAAMRDLAAAVAAGTPVPDTIVVSSRRPCEDPTDGVAGAARAAVVATLTLLQEWLAAPNLAGARLVVLTHRAVDAGSAPVDVAHAAVWGLIRVAQSEYPGRIVLLDAETPVGIDQLLPAAVMSGHPQIAVRDGRLWIPNLVPATAEAASPGGTGADRRGTLLVTGASGALGGLVARGLVGAGRAERVELLSRRGAGAPGAGALAAGLAGTGATVRVTACDAADHRSLAAVIASIPAETPLRGVIHAAGILDDGIVESLTPARVEAVMRPKVDGAWNLHELTKGLQLDDFVLFSSMAGIWGNAGQGNYAAANAFLDALAAHRLRAGLPATSLAWGPWQVDGPDAAGGMVGQIEDADRQRMARQGLQLLGSADGLALLDGVIARGRRAPGTVPALLVPVRLDLGALRRRNGVGLPPVLCGLVGGTASGAGRRIRRAVGPVGAPEQNGLAARLAALPAAARERAVQDLVRAQAAQVLGLSGPDAVDAGRSFLALGLTSLTALELRNRLSGVAGLPLAASVIFDYPTPDALAGYLCANVVPAETALPVLDGLDRLAALLSAVDQDSDRRSEIITRLEGMVADFRTRTEDNATAYRELTVASDDEIFDLLDRELGR